MDKIEVGEYVRLARCQGINKIIDIDEDGFLILDDNIADEYGDECCQISPQDADKEILKHSFNIINLIEINDIVNECLVVDLYKILKDINKAEEGMTEMIYLENGQVINKSNEIKNILTHEQYERNCYNVKEEE